MHKVTGKQDDERRRLLIVVPKGRGPEEGAPGPKVPKAAIVQCVTVQETVFHRDDSQNKLTTKFEVLHRSLDAFRGDGSGKGL